MIPGDLDRAKRVIELVMRHYDDLAARIAAQEPSIRSCSTSSAPTIDRSAGSGARRTVALGGPLHERLVPSPACWIDTGTTRTSTSRCSTSSPRPARPRRHERRALDLARPADGVDRELPLEDLDDAIEQLVLGVIEIADMARRPPSPMSARSRRSAATIPAVRERPQVQPATGARVGTASCDILRPSACGEPVARWPEVTASDPEDHSGPTAGRVRRSAPSRVAGTPTDGSHFPTRSSIRAPQ